ncbi:hypothetical protein [Streptomyces decoyicus]
MALRPRSPPARTTAACLAALPHGNGQPRTSAQRGRTPVPLPLLLLLLLLLPRE